MVNVVQSASRAIAKFRGEPESFIVRMRSAFGATGGMMSADALSILLLVHTDQPISRLARWIVDRQIVTFESASQRWIPMFQFDLRDMRVLHSVQRSILELRDVLDDSELTEWFATPNTWLTGGTPANLVKEQGGAVIEAARADRFAVSG